MTSSWIKNVQHVRNGEQVNASVTGRATRALERQTNYLRDLLDSLERGENLMVLDQTVDEASIVGSPVYWNSNNDRFESGLAAADLDPVTGVYTPRASADVLGIVAYKHNSTLGNVLLAGRAAVDISVAVDDPPAAAGRYYLSAQTAGRLTRTSPGVSIPVLFHDGSGVVTVMPQLRDLLGTHAHYQIELISRPAGTHVPPPVGNRHVITSPDSSLPGWLPADDSVFNGTAPLGAKFGYNIAQHPALRRTWPPIPLAAIALTIHEGVGNYGYDAPVDELVIADANTIWWMSECYGDVPWPTDFDSTGASSSSSASGSDCPRPTRGKYVVLSFARVRYATDPGGVSTLRGVSPLRVRHCDGTAGRTGDLEVLIDPDLQTTTDDALGSVVVKTINGILVSRGQVLEGLKAGNDSVTLSGTVTRRQTPNDSSTPLIHQGIVTVTANVDPATTVLPPIITRLDDVKERLYQDIPYLAFPSGQESSLRIKFRLPASSRFPANPRVRFRVVLLGRAAGTLPTLTMTARRLPSAGSAAVSLPTADSTLTITTSGSVGVDQYRESTSSALTPVLPEDTIFMTISRAVDGYAGEVGLLDISAILDSAS